MPTAILDKSPDVHIPVLIGKGMANSIKLDVGDFLQFAGLTLVGHMMLMKVLLFILWILKISN